MNNISNICEAPNCNNEKRKSRIFCCKHLTRLYRYNSFDLPSDKYERTPRACQKNLPDGIVKKCSSHGNLKIHEIVIYPGNDYIRKYCLYCRLFNQKKATAKRYGLSLKEYDLLLEKQKGLCGICKKSESMTFKDKIKKLTIDHCHKTGKVRGLLCAKCNAGLGLFRENIYLIENAKKYLKENQ